MSLAVLALGAVGALLLAEREPAVAGCLAPSDVVIDGNNAGGLLDANASGTLLYSRDIGGLTGQPEASLVRKFFGLPGDPLHVQGQTTGFSVGKVSERWDSFLSGSINSTNDVAFVAVTTAFDDPDTPEDESPLTATLFGQRGNTLYRIARRGSASPYRDNLGIPYPWGSLFDPQVAERGPDGIEVVFRGDLRTGQQSIVAGLFRWVQDTNEITTVALKGDPAPSGGVYDTVVRSRGNGGGDVVFFATADVGGSATPGLFLVPDQGTAVRVVKFGTTGDPAPGGGSFSVLGAFDIDDLGVITFSAAVAGGQAETGLFRASPPNYTPEVVLLQGDPTPLGGTFEIFTTSQVRASADGELALKAELSDDAGGGEGLFTIDAGTNVVRPLADTDGALTIASLGGGRIAYKEPAETRTVVPADGSDEGPTDFRLVRVDLRNAVPLRRDALTFEGRFQLPVVGDGVGEAPPHVFRAVDNARVSTTRSYAGDELTAISSVRLQVSESPGNEFVFGLTGDAARPTGTLELNGIVQPAPKVRLDADGDTATWRFRSADRVGTLIVNLALGTFRLKIRQANVLGSYDGRNFIVEFTLNPVFDGTTHDPQASLFHRQIRVDADQPVIGRVSSKGERVDGGTLYVDSVKVKRKLKVLRGQAAPQVTSDDVLLNGTLRNCPGASEPTTPGLDCSLVFGDLQLDGIRLERRGGTPRYQYLEKGGPNGRVKLVVDIRKGTFQLKVKGGPVHSQLVNADFTQTTGPNGSKVDVLGMKVPFSLRVARVYEATMDIPVVRRKGGKLFLR